MAKITILIEGVGIIFEEKDEADSSKNRWKILFPFNNRHRVNFVWENGAHINSESLAVEGGEVNIFVENPASEHEVGDKYDRFFDVKSIHTDGMKLKPDWEKTGIFVSIPNAKLSCFEETKSTFIVKENDVQIPNNQPSSIGYSASAEILLGANGSVTVEASKNNKPYFLKMFGEQDLTIKFDNDCPSPNPAEVTEISDYENLYEVIEDADTSEKRFSIVRFEKPAPANPGEVPITEILAAVGNTASSTASRIETNLSPFEEGVPCHLVKSSLPIQ